ncbi:hypothetical protein N7532_010236 [Penicillium argentinense]|uniref:Uncharacterized protein n=1 Tax=Penicillium argentinense TaxID=1131581 RepID=A0A9W9EPG4_9EURO|nr:uncharacterized protein N7532_010236 [Penicillium argentinense]KAJ5085465.1 hypothetical protein N7532_010236 [Penicillium argentinense]
MLLGNITSLLPKLINFSPHPAQIFLISYALMAILQATGVLEQYIRTRLHPTLSKQSEVKISGNGRGSKRQGSKIYVTPQNTTSRSLDDSAVKAVYIAAPVAARRSLR